MQSNSVGKALEYKNKCLQIVQRYIDVVEHNDESISSFLEDCQYITRSHYEDITEERSCCDQCGYPLCSSSISKTNYKSLQTYQIRNNKVYDITKRKNFCSDKCYKRSEYLRQQISTEPIYLRKDPNIQLIQLYTECKGLVGDEIALKDPIENLQEMVATDIKKAKEAKCDPEKIVMKDKTKQEILKVNKRIENKLASPYVKDETMKELKKQFSNLIITEKNVLDLKTDDTELTTENVSDVSNSHQTEYYSTMPLKNESANIIDFIDEVSMSGISTISNLSSSKVAEFKRKKIFNELISKIGQWITNDTRILLNVPIINDLDENAKPLEIIDEDPQKKLEKYRWEYVRLCAKLNEEEIEDKKYDEMVLKRKSKAKPLNKKPINCSKAKTNTCDDQETTGQEKSDKVDMEKITAFFKGQLYNTEPIDEKKKVRFKEQPEEPKEECPDKKTDEEHLFTPIHETLKPNIKRKNIFLTEIRNIVEEILDQQMELIEIASILEQIRILVDSFQMTSQNISLGRKRNILISIFLLRIVINYGMIDSEKYSHLFETNLIIGKLKAKFHFSNETLDQCLHKVIMSPDLII
ncbi:RNA polymerase II associated protein 2 [Blomia tropicalis]|nr:RNA polymerase II associated protein 2 [Blomia tropicalis]